MNLKLFKPDYINEKKEEKIDYSFFDEYISKFKTNKEIKGGIGHHKQVYHNLKKYHALNVIEQQYEMKTIIKRFKQTLGLTTKRGSIEHNTNNNFNSTNRKQIRNDTYTISSKPQSQCLITQQLSDPNRVLSSQTRKKKPNTIINDYHFMTREKPIMNPLIIDNRCFSHNILLSTSKKANNAHCSITEERKVKMKKNYSTKNRNIKTRDNNYDHFIQIDKYKNVKDRNVLFERLKQKFDFFKQEETFFEKYKWKKFKAKENSRSLYHFHNKYSTHSIKVMQMRDKDHDQYNRNRLSINV